MSKAKEEKSNLTEEKNFSRDKFLFLSNFTEQKSSPTPTEEDKTEMGSWKLVSGWCQDMWAFVLT